MHVLIIGGAGMIGGKLAQRLARDGELAGNTVSSLTLYDVVAATPPAAAKMPVKIATGDLPAAGEAEKLIAERPDLDLPPGGHRFRRGGARFRQGLPHQPRRYRRCWRPIRAARYRRASSSRAQLPCSARRFPTAIGDEFFNTPLTSYGTQKTICELLISDYTRKGLLDGLSIRLPTICVRPGKPNKAASGFFSNIMREPLAGEPAVLPVSESVRHWHASPRRRVGFPATPPASTPARSAPGAR